MCRGVVSAAGVVCALLALNPAARSSDEPPIATATTPAAATPAHPPQEPVLFRPGVWIDWQRREVRVQGRVVLRAGALEFLACFAGKEHESIVRFEASAVDIYMALGLIGIVPGHPPQWQPRAGAFSPPAGDLVDISFRWQHEGRTQVVDAYEWLREIEYHRTPLSRPWVFAGSRRRSAGGLSADASGVGIALVDFSDSLIALSRRHPSRYGDLWVVANTPAIPALGTSVQLTLRPAAPCRHSIVLDFRGVAWCDGRYCSWADFADLVMLARRADAAHVQSIVVEGTLASDRSALRAALLKQGVPADAFRFEKVEQPNGPTSPPQ